MSLKLMYITNDSNVASIAQGAGVDRIFVDMEYINKEERQAGMNTVKSFHTMQDVENISGVTRNGSSQLLVRVNPIHKATKDYCSSEEEISNVISCGADIIMLPMFTTCKEVENFISIVSGQARTMLLIETKEAAENIDEILSINGIDEVHIGLNDLHLAYRRKFMFELLADGTVENLTNRIRIKNIPFGFGGIARIGYGILPAEYIIAEHYRLGSQAAILSRSFCNADKVEDTEKLIRIFNDGISSIRAFEKKVATYTYKEYQENCRTINLLVNKIIGGANET